MSLNKVMLIGNVGADPEIRYINNSQTKTGRIRLATTDNFKDRNGENREITEWHTINVWRASADFAEKYIRKGSQIYVEGRLQTREWTDQSGAKRYSTEIEASNIQLLGKKSDNPATQNGAGYAAPAAPQNTGYAQNQNIGGYQQPYQPAQPAVPQQPVVSPVPMPSAPANGNEEDGSDDLPF